MEDENGRVVVPSGKIDNFLGAGLCIFGALELLNGSMGGALLLVVGCITLRFASQQAMIKLLIDRVINGDK